MVAADTKNCKPNKIGIVSRMAKYVWLKFIRRISRTLMLNDIKMKKKYVAELGHNDRSEIYVDLKKIMLTLALKSISPKWLGRFD